MMPAAPITTRRHCPFLTAARAFLRESFLSVPRQRQLPAGNVGSRRSHTRLDCPESTPSHRRSGGAALSIVGSSRALAPRPVPTRLRQWLGGTAASPDELACAAERASGRRARRCGCFVSAARSGLSRAPGSPVLPPSPGRRGGPLGYPTQRRRRTPFEPPSASPSPTLSHSHPTSAVHQSSYTANPVSPACLRNVPSPLTHLHHETRATALAPLPPIYFPPRKSYNPSSPAIGALLSSVARTTQTCSTSSHRGGPAHERGTWSMLSARGPPSSTRPRLVFRRFLAVCVSSLGPVVVHKAALALHGAYRGVRSVTYRHGVDCAVAPYQLRGSCPRGAVVQDGYIARPALAPKPDRPFW